MHSLVYHQPDRISSISELTVGPANRFMLNVGRLLMVLEVVNVILAWDPDRNSKQKQI